MTNEEIKKYTNYLYEEHEEAFTFIWQACEIIEDLLKDNTGINKEEAERFLEVWNNEE